MTLIEKIKKEAEFQNDADLEIMMDFCPGNFFIRHIFDLCGENCSKKYNDHPDKCQRCWNQEYDNFNKE
jgi:hypothetical protein